MPSFSVYKYLLMFLLYTLSVSGQAIQHRQFRNYPVLTNLDSLEKVVYATKNSPTRYLQGLILLERARLFRSTAVNKDLESIRILSHQQHDLLGAAMYQFMKARIIRSDDVEESARLGLAAAAYFERTQDTTGMMNCYSHLLDLNTIDAVDRHRQNMVSYYNKLMTLGSQSSFGLDKLIRARAVLAYGRDLYGDESLALGEKAFTEAIALIDKNVQYEYQRTSFYGNMGNLYSVFKQYKKSLALYLKLYAIGDNSTATINNFNLSNRYLENNDYKNAELYATKALDFFHLYKDKNTVMLLKIYNHLATVLYKNKRYEAAWASRNSEDSLTAINTEKLKATAFLDLQTKYQTDQKEQENQQLQQEKRRLFFYLGSGLIFLLLIGFALIRLRLANRRIKELMTHRDQFYTLVAHDLREPITTLTDIGAVVSFLVKNNRTTDLIKVTNQIETVSSQTQLLLANMLEWGESNNYGLISKPQAIDISPLVEKLYETAKPLTDIKQILMSIDIPTELKVFTDPKALSTIIRNMIDNAKKNTDSGGAIRLFVEKLDNTKQVAINIKDSGRGISADKLAFIQQVFIGQVKPDVGDHGLGLGIILMASFAKKSQASIRVTSEVGVGSCFSLILEQR
ncbi:sensor histidine kinase [Spirosoma pollinicola]|uniref:histidine kinase n=1 Tax=Spirosoma pollinicola TaxID=2057025 RepID=A0A2K8YYM6_9BACT|nr:HAMP domain-containing sensor histidine kinase [Spirosoma pollinicola]AUD02648.1 hypothetical protein CWM47_12865 [Spirosoma pollinicola]